MSQSCRVNVNCSFDVYDIWLLLGLLALLIFVIPECGRP